MKSLCVWPVGSGQCHQHLSFILTSSKPSTKRIPQARPCCSQSFNALTSKVREWTFACVPIYLVVDVWALPLPGGEVKRAIAELPSLRLITSLQVRLEARMWGQTIQVSVCPEKRALSSWGRGPVWEFSVQKKFTSFCQLRGTFQAYGGSECVFII